MVPSKRPEAEEPREGLWLQLRWALLVRRMWECSWQTDWRRQRCQPCPRADHAHPVTTSALDSPPRPPTRHSLQTQRGWCPPRRRLAAVALLRSLAHLTRRMGWSSNAIVTTPLMKSRQMGSRPNRRTGCRSAAPPSTRRMMIEGATPTRSAVVFSRAHTSAAPVSQLPVCARMVGSTGFGFRSSVRDMFPQIQHIAHARVAESLEIHPLDRPRHESERALRTDGGSQPACCTH